MSISQFALSSIICNSLWQTDSVKCTSFKLVRKDHPNAKKANPKMNEMEHFDRRRKLFKNGSLLKHLFAPDMQSRGVLDEIVISYEATISVFKSFCGPSIRTSSIYKEERRKKRGRRRRRRRKRRETAKKLTSFCGWISHLTSSRPGLQWPCFFSFSLLLSLKTIN